jgi:hypothetical protein
MSSSANSNPEPRSFEGRAPDAATAEREREREREARRRRIERAKAAMESEPKMKTLSERKRVARNLWDLLEHYEKGTAGVRKATVLVAAEISNPEESTKRLPRYALRPSTEDQIQTPDARKAYDEKLRKLLSPTIKKYKEVALKGAELAGEDQDEALLQLLSGTRYLNSQTARREPDSLAYEAAETISEQLHAFVDRLAATHDLARYFTIIDEQRLVRHPQYPDRLIPHDCKELRKVSLPYRDTSFQFQWMVLGSLRLPWLYIGTVQADEERLALATAMGTLWIDDSEEADEAMLKNRAFPVRCIPTWDIFLAIGPFGAAERPVPIIIQVARTRIRPLDNVWIHLSDGCPIVIAFEENTIGEFDGHGWIGEEKTLSNEANAPDFCEMFDTVVLSMGRPASADAERQIEQAADSYNKEFSILSEPTLADETSSIGWDDTSITVESIEESSVEDSNFSENQCAGSVSSSGQAPRMNAIGDTNDCSLVGCLHKPITQEAKEVKAFSDSLSYSDLPPPDWIQFINLEAELGHVSPEDVMSLLTKPPYRRHRIEPQIPAVLWSDERQREYFHGASGSNDTVVGLAATPVLAPEGSLLALLERWWRGELQNRASLREELEREVRDAVERLDAHIRFARESLRACDIEPVRVPIDKCKHET